MRSYICLVISILLVLVAAIPQQKGKPKGDPRLWMTYKIPLPHPPFAPPDIGPLYLSPDFFKDYPDFSIKQRSRIRQRNLQYHRRHQKDIADRWRRTGERPTDQEILERAREIRDIVTASVKAEQERIRDPAGFVQPRLKRARNMRLEAINRIEAQIQDKTRVLTDLRQPSQEDDDRKVLREYEEKLKSAETVIDDCIREQAKIKAQMRELKALQQTSGKDSRKYSEIEQEIKQRTSETAASRYRQEQAKLAALSAKKGIRKYQNRINGRRRITERMETEMRILKDELDVLKEANNDTNSIAEDESEDQSEDQNKDENNFSMTGLGESARQWVQGVGGFLQDMKHRVSTEGGNNIRLGPLHTLPKPGLIGVP